MPRHFVSRHAGAREWAARRQLVVDHFHAHLDLDAVRPGDAVIGTLPIQLAAEVCARGAIYQHLTLTMPADWRGRELSADELEACGAGLTTFDIRQAQT